ncbi:MAG: glycosyltransferase family 4 protein [Candidatus Beckwithbacteria bacterium]|nr:glycosyltransferase family 4 protein [Candidatus Beckwithbacteria bacterium]
MSKKISVAILSYYSGSVSRGVETFVTEITRCLKSKFSLTVYSKKKDSKLTIKQFSQQTLRLLANNPPDILMPLNNGWMSWLSKLFCLKFHKKIILAGFAGIGLIDRFNLWLFPDRFICCTQAQATWAKTINPLAKLAVINLGVDTNRFSPEGKKFPLSLISPVVLCVAGPESYKRVNLAIQAVAQFGQVSLLVVGKQTEATNSLGKKLLGNRYQNLLVNYSQLDQVYRSCQLFTLPSAATEAYGITILEAMASGLPVIVNNDPIRRELVGSAGTLIDPVDLDRYVEAIRVNLNRKNNLSRQQALKFSWDEISRQYQKLWQSLAG